MSNTAEVSWNITLGWAIFGVAAVALVVALSAIAWRRSGYRAGVACLELLRIAAVSFAVLSLLQPEWREPVPRTERPVLAVLRDVSGSMETRDVAPADAVPAKPQARREWLDAHLDSDLWQPLRERVDVVENAFSTSDGVPGTDIHAALERALTGHEELRAVVLASDGDWNTGESPVAVAARLRLRGIPVFAVGVGHETPLPDVEVAALEPPTFSVVGKSLQIPFRLRSTLPQDYPVTVRLTIGDDAAERKKDVVVPAMGELRDMVFWTPEEVGEVTLKIEIPLDVREAIPDNNTRTVRVTIREESLKVLLVESCPRWEYRYLRNALERDPGVAVSCLLFHPGVSKRGGGAGYITEFPRTPEELARYDVVFLGDVGVQPGQLTPLQCDWLKGLVEGQASGLVFLPGFRGNQSSLLGTALRELYPVVLDASAPRGFGSRLAGRFLLTESGRRSLLTKLAEQDNEAVWRSLPGYQWRSPASRSKAGTEVLAVDEGSRAPLIVTKTYGTGKILFMGTDCAWRWREGVEDKYHYRFWGQVARWMAYQRHMAEGELLRFFYTPQRPQIGSRMALHSTVLDPSGAPFANGTIRAEVTAPRHITKGDAATGDTATRDTRAEGATTTRIAFRPERADWGLYSAEFTPTTAGDHTVRLICEETSAELEATFTVDGETREKLGKPARFDILREIAQVSRGEWIPRDKIETLQTKVLDLPEPEPWVRRVQLWANPYWGAALVLVLSVFWGGRKLRGMV